jgi:hypothetical protein
VRTEIDRTREALSSSLQKGRPVEGEPTVYRSVQEAVEGILPPKFQSVPSFNYEAAAA